MEECLALEHRGNDETRGETKKVILATVSAAVLASREIAGHLVLAPEDGYKCAPPDIIRRGICGRVFRKSFAPREFALCVPALLVSDVK